MLFKQTSPYALLVVMLLAILALAACGDDDDDAESQASQLMTPESATAMPGMSTMDMDMDLAFIDGMIVHHQSAIDMAELARDQGEHEEIRALAVEIIAAQQAEIDQMTAWRSAWFADEPETSGMPGMEHVAGMDMTSEDLDELRHADPFDRAFIDMMIPHHESAVMMAESLATTTQRPELQELAAEIIAAQRAEIEQMRAWRSDWFGD